MKGDFTRDTFNPTNHFSRVLAQQGRVTLDADSNEQSAILLHYLRTLARDLIGPYAAPIEAQGFDLEQDEDGGLIITKGRYYVDGILVENDEHRGYDSQPDYPIPSEDAFLHDLHNLQKPSHPAYWLYLDVWERHVTFLEDDTIREKALNGPDTCTRAQVIWQVRALPLDKAPTVFDHEACAAPLTKLQSSSNAQLAAEVEPARYATDPCIQAPSSSYRGAENQLYRVEIHQGGTAATATFKWSRDNGSTATHWLGSTGQNLLVEHTRGFEAGSWIELYDEVSEKQGKPGTLVLVVKVDGDTLSIEPTKDMPAFEKLENPKVRRWDQAQVGDLILSRGAVPIREAPAGPSAWIPLEDGLQVRFEPGGSYRTGDYWLIPARVATGGIEWPTSLDSQGKSVSFLLPPHGPEHHYAPLGFVTWKDGAPLPHTCGCVFTPLSSCFEAGAPKTVAHAEGAVAPKSAVPKSAHATASTKKGKRG
jgi:hypothetical protein